MIEYKNISLQFNDKTIFNDFNIHISEGEKVLLNAPSGKGKSTLIKMLLGFIRPDGGHLYLNGTELNKGTVKEFRKNISYVSQDVDLMNQNVRDFLKGLYDNKTMKNKTYNESYTLEFFKLFNLDIKLLDKDINNLSGGERQRLGLVICILLERQVWLLDEITSGLDEEMKRIIINYVINTDKTVMIISHDKLWLEYDKVREVRW